MLELAVVDAFAKRIVARSQTGTTSIRDRDDARRLLFDQEGEWARWRRHVCWMADMDPDAFEERLKILGGADVTS